MKRFRNIAAVLFSIILFGSMYMSFGCGGESSVTAPTATTAPGGDTSTISGTAVKGPVSGGMVTAYAVNNGTKGAQLANSTTDAQGNFMMTISGYSGPVMMAMTGGTYTDEATGSTMTMASNDMMTAAIPSISSREAVTGIQMTPLTSMAQTMAGGMSGGMTAVNMSTANVTMGNYYMVNDILHTPPMNPNVSGSGSGASQDMRNYGMALAAMMEKARALGMTSSSGMVTAMMNDASDGIMNGMMTGSTPINMGGGGNMMGGSTMMQTNMGTSGMANSMTTFMNSAMNKSGLTVADMQALINQLNSSSGTIK